MTLTTYGTQIDMREIPPRDRQSLVLTTLRSLGSGESMELVHDLDPTSLLLHLQTQELPGRYGWEDLQHGPQLWRVRITKFEGPHPDDGSCCSCSCS
jgi:uncharacterized protein (DUF2249 family)